MTVLSTSGLSFYGESRQIVRRTINRTFFLDEAMKQRLTSFLATVNGPTFRPSFSRIFEAFETISSLETRRSTTNNAASRDQRREGYHRGMAPPAPNKARIARRGKRTFCCEVE